MSARAARTAAAVGLAGLVGAVAGMFLPWFRSGAVLRDSFEVIGVVEALGMLEGAAVLLYGWYAVVPAVTLGIAAYALGARRTGAAIALVVAVFLGTVSGVAYVQSNADALVGVAATGPVVTLAGAALVVAGALGVLAGARRSRKAGGEP